MISVRPDEWRRVREVFDRALAVPMGQRQGFLTEACLENENLHRQVLTLLDAHERADDFLETACVVPAVEWPDEDLSGAQFGPYRLDSRIGGGGMGEVYRAHDTRLGRPVAIKVLLSHVAVDEPARQRFEREARVVAGLNHPHICTLHDVGTYRGSTAGGQIPYLVMEFLDGETLADRLTRGPLAFEDALDCAIEIASALDTAHRAGIVHRDLKPRNIMLTAAGAKLLDFGLAKAAARPALPAPLAPEDLTTPGTIVGTMHYMAPEQLQGQGTDARTDLFAFGCVLYETLAGRKAFEGRSGAGPLTAILALEPRPIRALVPSLPNALETLIGQCLAKRPQDRWQSATELLEELNRIAENLRASRTSGRHPVRALVLTGTFVTLFMSAAGWVVLSRPAPPSLEPGRATAAQLAVLPLRMIGSVAESDEHLGVGIADSIITRLAAVRQIGLRPTAAVLRYADAPEEPGRVAEALAVGHVLVGTIQRNSDTYRITLQLVESAEGTVTWARSYDVLRSALSNLQDTVADQVVGALRLELTPAERDRVRRRYTDNTEAYDLYLRGRASFVNYTEASMKEAIGDFERALAIDPDYALARASLATASAWFSIRYAYETEASEWGARAEREAKAALAADPSLAEATLATASAAGTQYGAFNWPVVITEATRALSMDPTLELAHLVRMRAFFHLGLFDRMAEEAREAQRLNPLGNIEIARLEVAGHLFGGSYERAREQAAALLARSDAPVIRNYLGLAQFYSGDVAGARATLAAVQRAGRPDVRSQAALAGVEAAAGDHAAARARAVAIERGPYMDHHVAYSLAAAWAQLGDVRASVKWLQQAAETGFPCYPAVRQDRLLDPIRRDPEVVALLDRLRQRYEQDAAQYPEGS
jgi:serine/threonine protein kinase/tetratricopeptide (TPR) repeat protein